MVIKSHVLQLGTYIWLISKRANGGSPTRRDAVAARPWLWTAKDVIVGGWGATAAKQGDPDGSWQLTVPALWNMS
jgi:hypothetical protein